MRFTSGKRPCCLSLSHLSLLLLLMLLKSSSKLRRRGAVPSSTLLFASVRLFRSGRECLLSPPPPPPSQFSPLESALRFERNTFPPPFSSWYSLTFFFTILHRCATTSEEVLAAAYTRFLVPGFDVPPRPTKRSIPTGSVNLHHTCLRNAKYGFAHRLVTGSHCRPSTPTSCFHDVPKVECAARPK